MKPCISCGALLEDLHRCTDCRTEQRRQQHSYTPKSSPRQRGYDSRWDALSRRARRIQPWCTDCGALEDLTADHSPEAWERKAAGLPIRLRDVDVVCRTCNGDRGSARPGGPGSGTPPGTRAGQAERALHTPGGYA